jgi:hypothetical protein
MRKAGRRRVSWGTFLRLADNDAHEATTIPATILYRHSEAGPARISSAPCKFPDNHAAYRLGRKGYTDSPARCNHDVSRRCKPFIECRDRIARRSRFWCRNAGTKPPQAFLPTSGRYKPPECHDRSRWDLLAHAEPDVSSQRQR